MVPRANPRHAYTSISRSRIKLGGHKLHGMSAVPSATGGSRCWHATSQHERTETAPAHTCSCACSALHWRRCFSGRIAVCCCCSGGSLRLGLAQGCHGGVVRGHLPLPGHRHHELPHVLHACHYQRRPRLLLRLPCGALQEASSRQYLKRLVRAFKWEWRRVQRSLTAA